MGREFPFCLLLGVGEAVMVSGQIIYLRAISLLWRKLGGPQESAMRLSVLIYHSFVGTGFEIRDGFTSVFLVEIYAHTFHLSVTENLTFWALCTSFNHIYRSEPKLAIDAFHPLSVWTLLFDLHVAQSVGPLSEMHLWVIPWNDFEYITLSDVRHNKLTFHIFGCNLSGSLTAFLSPVLVPGRFTSVFGYIIGFISSFLRLIVSFWFVLAYKIFPVLPPLLFLYFGNLVLFLHLF